MSEPVTQNKQLGLLGLLPVEIRHRIYHFVALRDTDFILKVWFEKIDPNIDTSTPTFVSYPAYSEEEDEEDEEDEGEEDEDSDGDEAAAEETAGNNQSAVVNGSGQNRTQGHSEDVTMVDATQVRAPIRRVIELSSLARTNLTIGYPTSFQYASQLCSCYSFSTG